MIRKALFFFTITIIFSLLILRDEFGGPHRLLHCPLPLYCNTPHIQGTTTEHYQHVVANAERLIQSGDDIAFQYSQYENGEKVVGLVGTVQGEFQSFDEDSLVPIFSSGKNVEAIVMMLLWEKGLVRYEDKVVVYWPEFGQNGKENVTIADVLRHSAGLCVVDELLFEERLKGSWGEEDWDRVAAVLAASDAVEMCLAPKRGYHAFLRGTILNEIVRRVDPQRRTIAHYFNDEVNKKANTQIYCGNIPQELSDRVVDIEVPSAAYLAVNFLLPYVADTYLGTSFLRDDEVLCLDGLLNPDSPMSRYFRVLVDKSEGTLDARITGSSRFREFELTSVLCVSNANSLAKIGGALANGGVVEGIRLFSEESINEALSEPVFSGDGALGFMTSTMTKGGFGQSELLHAPKSYIGWGGWSGSSFIFDPKARVSIGYVPVGFRKHLVEYTRSGSLERKN